MEYYICRAVRLETTAMAEAGKRSRGNRNAMDRELFRKHVFDGNSRRERGPKER